MDAINTGVVTDNTSQANINKTEKSVIISQNAEENSNNYCGHGWFNWCRSISVEPCMFLYMFSFMMTSVAEDDFFVQKACRVNLNYSQEICYNIKKIENGKYKEQVQLVTAQYYQWQSITAHSFPIILALFLGSFSDRFGRKLPLLLGLAGKLLYSLMIILNAYMSNWTLQYVLFTAVLPCAFTGSDLAIFSSCFAYLSDISTVNKRTLRMTILDVVYLLAMPTGIPLGSYLYNGPFKNQDPFNTYIKMFALNAALLILAILCALTLKWQTTLKQQTLRTLSFFGFFVQFFDKDHIKDTYNVLIKRRTKHHRAFIIILLISMALYSFQRDETQYLYIYTGFKFGWDFSIYSLFKTFKSSAYVIGVLLAVPIMHKLFHWRDTTIIFVGASNNIIARSLYFFARNGKLFYIGALISGFGPVVAPMLRSITSKIVPQTERGKMFALLAVCDNATPVISGILYSQVYQATLNADGKGGQGIFLLTIASQISVFLLTLYIHILLDENDLNTPENIENENDNISTQTNLQNSDNTNLT